MLDSNHSTKMKLAIIAIDTKESDLVVNIIKKLGKNFYGSVIVFTNACTQVNTQNFILSLNGDANFFCKRAEHLDVIEAKVIYVVPWGDFVFFKNNIIYIKNSNPSHCYNDYLDIMLRSAAIEYKQTLSCWIFKSAMTTHGIVPTLQAIQACGGVGFLEENAIFSLFEIRIFSNSKQLIQKFCRLDNIEECVINWGASVIVTESPHNVLACSRFIELNLFVTWIHCDSKKKYYCRICLEELWFPFSRKGLKEIVCREGHFLQLSEFMQHVDITRKELRQLFETVQTFSSYSLENIYGCTNNVSIH